jgi:FkbM family methyltransferase
MEFRAAAFFLKMLLSDVLGGCVALIPFRFGKYLLMKAGVRLLASAQRPVVVPVLKDDAFAGAYLPLRFPEDIAYMELYYRGYVDHGSVDFLQHFLQPEDVVFDAGANLGYYALIASLAVSKGEVHAFEPVPSTYERLQGTLALNPRVRNVVANQIAIAKASGQMEIHTFTGLHHGYSSLSTLGRKDIVSHTVVARSLDDYVAEQRIRRVDFLKVDVEGAEAQVLAGATAVLGKWAPSVMLEVNFESARSNGFEPADLLRKLLAVHAYTLFRFPNAWGQLAAMAGPDDIENGDNVVAISQRHLTRLRA